MNKTTQIALVVIASFMAWVLYQNMVVVPESKLAYEKTLQQNKEISFSKCSLQAAIDYDTNWDSQCRAAGKAKNCTLMKYVADTVEASYDTDKKNCVTMYK